MDSTVFVNLQIKVRMMKKAILFSLVLMLHSVAQADELLMEKSSRSVSETIDRVEAAAKDQGFVIVARVDHAAAAAKVGLTLRSTALLIFGNPKVGTLLMRCDQRVGIDLPLKALAWQDKDGQVWLGATNPAALKSRYELDAACDAPVASAQKVIKELMDYGAKGS
ncbi:DUF302 domain-containing protein [Burkholderia sp. PAMC 28687]|uniref:DUF302 domain-containing protein n=1 Tax=Burkholderia sp. PAMC 28687 TaxID=1795874 RepID=UPI001E51C457|nr:DUF302 domain-containing protein [Burkholderia sp. PAMC 28687]